jgi:hypothetical protein
MVTLRARFLVIPGSFFLTKTYKSFIIVYKGNKMVTQQQLKDVLNYNPATGIFTWAKTRSSRSKMGKIAGTKSNRDGRIYIRINNIRYTSYRLAWLYVYGYWPIKYIDHINGIKDDNRICNLREATHSENLQNQPSVKANGKLLGTYYNKNSKKWHSQITKNKKQYHLGSFNTEQEAHQAYLAAKIKLHTFNPIPRP